MILAAWSCVRLRVGGIVVVWPEYLNNHIMAQWHALVLRWLDRVRRRIWAERHNSNRHKRARLHFSMSRPLNTDLMDYGGQPMSFPLSDGYPRWPAMPDTMASQLERGTARILLPRMLPPPPPSDRRARRVLALGRPGNPQSNFI